MPDLMDQVQQLAEDNAADALARHADRPRAVGRTHCIVGDCGMAIHPARTALGAQRCIDCQQAEEVKDARYARGRCR